MALHLSTGRVETAPSAVVLTEKGSHSGAAWKRLTWLGWASSLVQAQALWGLLVSTGCHFQANGYFSSKYGQTLREEIPKT